MNNKSRRILVDIANHPYEVVIAAEGLNRIGTELNNAGINSGIKVLVVTNPDVAKPYSNQFLESLKQSGYRTSLLVLEAGENQKNQNSIARIHDAAYSTKLERGSLMIALGGGVIGDMTGFAAATWLRGISIVQVPTTLLSMVDASIGGKTGVNHTKGKNLIGAFHQPKLVLIDPSTLQTLPEREFHAGMAEVIKYGVICDPQLFSILEEIKQLNNLYQMELGILEEIIGRSVSSKAKIVSEDEYENGRRAILNYGHTFGHAIETLCGYGKWLHGEAVAMGMVAAGELALVRGNWTQNESDRQKLLLTKFGLPTKWPRLNIDDIISTLKGDKKVQNETIRFILPTEIGKAKIFSDVTHEEIKECLKRLS